MSLPPFLIPLAMAVARSLAIAMASALLAGPAAGGQTRKPRKTTSVIDPDMAPLLDTLQRLLQTRVRIVGGADRGKIEIDYFEKEDFNRIVTMLMEATP